ncbi:hypothetical protein [Bacillus phage SPO1L1]|nr:hypothetical protein [Bacillus phage SPO1L1]WIT26091.1 hypothetical protein [Bacillus phage SPO1L2]
MDIPSGNTPLMNLIKERTQSMEKVKEITKVDSLIGMMDHIENVIRSCGGDKQCSFLDVSRDFIKIHSRITTKISVFPVVEENQNNPRVHKRVAEILMGLDQVQSVRWIPREDGAFLLVTFDLNKGKE